VTWFLKKRSRAAGATGTSGQRKKNPKNNENLDFGLGEKKERSPVLHLE
jgi:hypothetical protein